MLCLTYPCNAALLCGASPGNTAYSFLTGPFAKYLSGTAVLFKKRSSFVSYGSFIANPAGVKKMHILPSA